VSVDYEVVIKQEWKYKRRDKKRHRAIKRSKITKEFGHNNLSKKDVYLVTGYKNGDRTDEFEIEISASRFNGDPKEYEAIKEICRSKLRSKITILEVVSG